MGTRHHPVITIERDHSGNDLFDHEAADLTPRLIGMLAESGTSLSPFATSFGWQRSVGAIQLDNADGRFNLIGGVIEARHLVANRRVRILHDGIVWWQGRCTLNAEALAHDPAIASFTLDSRGAPYFDGMVEWVNNLGRRLMSEALPAFAAERQRHTDDAAYSPFSIESQARIGRLFYNGGWPGLLNRMGNLAGGWFCEVPSGTVRFIGLEAAKAQAALAIDATMVEQDDGQRGGALPDTVTNETTQTATVLVPDPRTLNDAGVSAAIRIASENYAATAGQPLTVSWQYRPNPSRRLVTWFAESVRITGVTFDADSIRDVVESEFGIRFTFTPTATGTATVEFFGIPWLAAEAYSVVDRSATDVARTASVGTYGARALDLPSWQANPPDQDTLDLQRRFMRSRMEPLRLVAASWPINQATIELAALLRQRAAPGRVVTIRGRKTLLLGRRITYGPGHRPPTAGQIDAYGIDLDAITVPAALPPLTMPGDATTPESTTSTPDADVTDALSPPPTSCDRAGDVVTITWESGSAADRPGRVIYAPLAGNLAQGIRADPAFNPQGPADDRRLEPNTFLIDGRLYGPVAAGSFGRAVGVVLADGVGAFCAATTAPTGISFVRVTTMARWGRVINPATGRVFGRDLTVADIDGRTITAWYQPDGTPAALPPSADWQRRKVTTFVMGSEAEFAPTETVLHLARGAATVPAIAGRQPPAGTKIAVRTNQLAEADLRALTGQSVTVRSYAFDIGRLLRVDVDAPFVTAYWTGAFPADFDCDDFDLTSPGATRRPTGVFISSDAAGANAITSIPASGLPTTVYLNATGAAEYQAELFTGSDPGLVPWGAWPGGPLAYTIRDAAARRLAFRVRNSVGAVVSVHLSITHT